MNILLVEDHVITSLGMSMTIKNIVQDAIIHVAYNYSAAIQVSKNHHIDFVILDLSIPGGIGTSMIQGFRSIHPDIKILIFSGHDEYLNAVNYINHGANGFLHKHCTREETENAILIVINGKQYMSIKLLNRIYQDYLNYNVINTNPLKSLSYREREVFDLIIEGASSKEIAIKLNVKCSTVSTQKLRIFKKFLVNNIVDLIKKVEKIADNHKLTGVLLWSFLAKEATKIVSGYKIDLLF